MTCSSVPERMRVAADPQRAQVMLDHMIDYGMSRYSWFIDDLGSLNGTYVNSQRVEEAALNHGDEIQIGRFRLVAFFG